MTAAPRRRRRSWARRKHLGLKTTAAVVALLVLGVGAVVLTWNTGRPSFGDQVAAAAASVSASPAAPVDSPTTTRPRGPRWLPRRPARHRAATPARPSCAARSRGIAPGRWTLAATNGFDYTIVVTDATVLPKRRTFASFAVGATVSVRGTLAQGTITAAAVTVPAATASASPR